MAENERIPRWRMALYAVGQLGSSLLGYVTGTLITYFYLPPQTGQATFPVLVEPKAVFGGMTVVGLAGFLGGISGLVVDPVVGTLSDRSRARMGRRRFFMCFSALPLAALSFLLFTPPSPRPGALNAAWVFAVMLCVSLFGSLYRLPWGALQPELGVTSADRMLLSTFGSVAWIAGVLLGYAIYPVKDLLEGAGLSPLSAFHAVVALFACVSLAAMLFPVLFVDERRYCSGHVSRERPLESIALALRNRDFVVSTAAQAVYVIADTLLNVAMVYFITIMLKLPESWAFTLAAVLVFLSFAWYPLVNVLARRTGKKRMVIFAFALQALIFVMFAGARQLAALMPFWVLAALIILLQSVVAAVTGIVPGAIASDVIRADSVRTGTHKEASFAGAATLINKIPASLPALVFPSFLLLGRSIENPAGVRLTAIVAFFIMIAAMAVLSFYNEKRTLATLATEGAGERGQGGPIASP
jgi:glycoside/pentoside/hexuronide:cation symporter, GPH family